MDPENLDLTILMPCLNEAETLERCILKAKKSLADLGLKGEVLIADNGSTDGSIELSERSGARVVRVAQKGYGNALRYGIEAAHGRWVIMGDADDSYDFSKIGPFIEKLRDGYDLVMGCRMPRGGGTIMPGAMPWKHRWIGNPVLSLIGRIFFKCPAQDFHCGLRGFSKVAYEKMKLQTTGMEFASEMVIKSTMKGLKIGETPITLHKDGRSRPPHLRSWRDGWRHLRFMLLFSPRWLLLYPGLVMLVTGAGFFARLMLGPITLQGVNFDLNTLEMASLLVQFGYQMVLLAGFVRIFAYTRGFLPHNHILSKAFSFFNLEKGLLAGLAILLVGFGLISLTLLDWATAGFGNLDPLANTRPVIAGRTLVSLGLQTLIFSLVFSYLGIDEKPSKRR